jgi:hypothetical protein
MARARDSSTCGDIAGMVVTGGSGNALDSEADGGESKLGSGSVALVGVESVVVVFKLVVIGVVSDKGSSGNVGVVLEPSGVVVVVVELCGWIVNEPADIW